MSNDGWHVAQVNIALPVEPLDTPALEDFVALLEPVNALADSAPGFVWRLQTEDGDATSIRAFGDDRLIVNMSAWESIEALWAYVYDDGHLEAMRRRREWFTRMAESHMVLWWIPAGELPSVAEAERRLALLRERGPTPDAFTFKQRFGPPPRVARPQLPERLPKQSRLMQAAASDPSDGEAGSPAATRPSSRESGSRRDRGRSPSRSG